MSVINKMLRDLDSRQTKPTAGGLRPVIVQPDLTAGTMAVGKVGEALVAPADQANHSLRLGFWVLTVALLAGLGWWVYQRQQEQPVTAQAPTAPAPSVPVVPAQINPALPVATATIESPTAEKPSLVASAQPAAPAAATTGKAVAPKPVNAPATIATKAVPTKVFSGQLREATELSPSSLAKRSAAQSVVLASKPAPATAEPPKLRPPATQEVLAQAQERWNLGERAQAIALLQAAITRLEGAGASEVTALAALTREYVRMTLAQGQVSAAASVLARLEQPLATVADIWALRGNVAQRLGHHPEAVRAYLKGLELRPMEPRWMLGAAVSLAAQGQVGPAGDLAAQARQAGVLPPDVANYLLQLGVVLPRD